MKKREGGTIIRSGKTIQQAINDERLSFKAIGIYYVILSTQRAGRVNIGKLRGHSSSGYQSLQSGIRELICMGYLLRVIGEDDADMRLPAREWEEIRERVFRRDDYTCQYCGATARLACDHKTPLSRGGTNEISNLITACLTCNTDKRNLTIEEWMGEQ